MISEFKGTVGIYIRVSTLEQAEEGYSIAAQKDRLKAYCKAQGWTDFKIYVDEGISAKDLKRPELQKMLEDVKEGRVNLILVYKLDRFTRSVRDLHKMLEVMDSHNCGFRSATEVYDTTSAMGRLFITIVAALAEWESANSSERIKMMLEKKVSDGERVGNTPYGFDENEDESLDINPGQRLVILDMISKLKSGMNPTSIAEDLRASGNNDRSWTAAAVYRILRNPALQGDTRWVDKIYEDTHPAITSRKEFAILQDLLNGRAKLRRPEIETTYLFQGVILCSHCGDRLYVNRYFREKSDGTEKHSAVYRCKSCAAKGKKVNTPGEDKFLSGLYTFMDNFEVEKGEAALEQEDDVYSNLVKELKSVESMRAKYQRGWAADMIEDEEFSRLMDETLIPYERAKKNLAEYKEYAPVDLGLIQESVLFFNRNFKHLTNEEQRAFVAEFIKEIHFEMIPQPPKDPRSKTGKPLLAVTDVVFR